MNGFMVRLYLKDIFKDHRSNCRIFVNFDKMKTIKDLQDHISAIFNIKHFYLMVQNVFLPSMENIRILSPDDVISAIPLEINHSKDELNVDKCNSSISSVEDSTSKNEEICRVKKKRKKKNNTATTSNKKMKHLHTLNSNGKCTSTPYDLSSGVEMEENETNKTSHKEKKLKKVNLTRKMEEEFTEIVEKTGANSKNSVKDKVEYFEKYIDQPHLMNSVEDSDKDQSEQFSNNLFREEPEHLNISDLMRKHKLYVKPNEYFKKMSTELPQQHNIVKSIIVSMDTSKDSTSSGYKSQDVIKARSESVDNTEKSINCKSESKVNVLQHIILTPKEDHLNHPCTSFQSELINSNDLIETQPQQTTFVTKRKRVRTRKRKSKDQKLPPKAYESSCNLKMKMSKGTPAIHIKFNEDSDEEKIIIDDQVQEAPQEVTGEVVNIDLELSNDNEKKIEHLHTLISIGNSTSTPYDLTNNPEQEENETNKTSHTEKNLKNINLTCKMEEEFTETPQELTQDVVKNDFEQSSVKKNISEQATGATIETKEDFFTYVSETIEKCPLVVNRMPQVGSTIAFKLLKLGYQFTPQLTNYIIGKVREVSQEEKCITVNILDGLEEAKIAAESSFLYNESIMFGVDTIQKYEWCHLVETRLLSM